MNNYQLFKSIPNKSILDKLENIYPIKDFREKRITFTKQDMVEFNTIDKLNEYLPTLKTFYLPCKQKMFLNCLCFRRAMTILRQILRIFSYKVLSKERFTKYKKHYEYWIVFDSELGKNDEEQYNRTKKNIVFFD